MFSYSADNTGHIRHDKAPDRNNRLNTNNTSKENTEQKPKQESEEEISTEYRPEHLFIQNARCDKGTDKGENSERKSVNNIAPGRFKSNVVID